VLAALPIYQAAFILAPKSVTDQISKLLREFLWQGGKGNLHKFHLVRWETVKCPIAEGGLHIRDPAMVNQAFGGKIVWNLFTHPQHPVSVILKAKYAPHVQTRNLHASHTRFSSQVWRLCNKSLNFVKEKAYRIPGNGKHTKLWKDRIMDRDPLKDNDEITDLKEWLERAGINSVYDLSKWDSHDDWKGWDFYGVPDRLKHNKAL
jgi:hypothetical protein